MPHQGDKVTLLRRGLGTPDWARQAHERRSRERAAARPRVAPAVAGSSFVTIVAHSDDDLLFVNPDLQPAIMLGRPVRTIVLTCDEFNGAPGLTREQLAAQLREGARQAYAYLAQVANNWRRETMVVAERTVEVATLIAAPHVQTIWLNLPDGGDDLHPDALMHLWQTPGYVTDTLVPTGGPVTQVQQYDGNRLYSVLLGLLDLFQPTTIRTQDPLPDERRKPEHSDHVAATAFAQLAVRTYEGPAGSGGAALLQRYRCYNTDESPANVPPALLTPKTDAYKRYNALDPLSGNAFDDNLPRGYQRFPVSAPWAIKDGTGVLHAVVVGADGVLAWRQNAGATTWTGPTRLVAGSFAPGVAMARNANGRVQLAVRDLDTAAVMTTKQTAAGGNFGAWTSLGSPDTGLRMYGTPVLGVNSDRCLELYVLDSSGGLSNAYQAAVNGPLTGWFAVGGGPEVMGQPAVVTAPGGRLHVLADNNGRISHWIQPPGGGTSPDPGFPAVESVAAPSAVVEAGGLARLLTREWTDGAVGTSVETAANGAWTGLTHLGGQGGIGPVAAVLSGGTAPRLLVFARNDIYGISLSRQAANGTFGAWQDLGGYCEIGPAAVVDNAGLVRLLIVGTDCRLYERKQTAAGPTGAFANWQAVGT